MPVCSWYRRQTVDSDAWSYALGASKTSLLRGQVGAPTAGDAAWLWRVRRGVDRRTRNQISRRYADADVASRCPHVIPTGASAGTCTGITPRPVRAGHARRAARNFSSAAPRSTARGLAPRSPGWLRRWTWSAWRAGRTTWCTRTGRTRPCTVREPVGGIVHDARPAKAAVSTSSPTAVTRGSTVRSPARRSTWSGSARLRGRVASPQTTSGLGTPMSCADGDSRCTAGMASAARIAVPRVTCTPTTSSTGPLIPNSASR